MACCREHFRQGSTSDEQGVTGRCNQLLFAQASTLCCWWQACADCVRCVAPCNWHTPHGMHLCVHVNTNMHLMHPNVHLDMYIGCAKQTYLSCQSLMSLIFAVMHAYTILPAMHCLEICLGKHTTALFCLFLLNAHFLVSTLGPCLPNEGQS